MLEVLSRFNVTTYGPILNAINGIVAANLVRGNEMGEKKYHRPVESFSRSQQSAPWTHFILHGGHAVSAWKVEHARVAISTPDIFPCLCSSFFFCVPLVSSFISFFFFNFFDVTRDAQIFYANWYQQYTRANAMNDSANIFCWDTTSFLQSNISKK